MIQIEKLGRGLGLALQVLNMFSDLALIFVVAWLAVYESWALALVLAVFIQIATQDIGGWFYAWQPTNIAKFRQVWNGITVKNTEA